MGAGFGLIAALSLLAIAAVHANWAMGGRWPLPAGDAPMGSVIPEGMPIPTPSQTWAVVALLTAGAALTMTSALGAGHWIVVAGTATVAGVLAARAIGGFVTSGIIRRDSRFARLDRYYYSPLCLLLAAGALAPLVA